MKNIMERAHKLAKQMEGDYAARLALALRQAWKEAKTIKLNDVREMMTVAKNENWTAREWSGYGKQRVYFNFKGRGEGVVEIKNNKVASVKIDHSVLQKAFNKIVGKEYKFGA
jgi:transposase